MAIDTINPLDSSVLRPGDAFSFMVDDTYTSLTIEAIRDAGTEFAYDTALGGAQSGYTVQVVAAGGRHTFTVSRTSGWDNDPQQIRVIENETGSSATTTFSYYLTDTKLYPDSMNPYGDENEGSLIISASDVKVRGDVTWIDLVGATVADLGVGKVRVTVTGGGVSVFTGLTDTPSSYASQALKGVRVNAGETALEFYTIGVASTFVGLSDTPSVYTSQSLKGVRVNAGETALEFYTTSTNPTLDSVVTGGTPDNDVTVPTAAPIILRGAAAGDTPLTVSKAFNSTTVPVVQVDANNSTQLIAVLGNLTSAAGWQVFPDSIVPIYAGAAGYVIGGGSGSGVAGNLNIAGSDRTDAGNGGDVVIYAGDADGASGTGGNIQIRAGASVGGDEGIVAIGVANTNLVALGAATNEVRTQSGLTFLERAAVPVTPAATFGQTWVKSDAVQKYMFTDDAGVETTLGPRTQVVSFWVSMAAAGGTTDYYGTNDVSTTAGWPAQLVMTTSWGPTPTGNRKSLIPILPFNAKLVRCELWVAPSTGAIVEDLSIWKSPYTTGADVGALVKVGSDMSMASLSNAQAHDLSQDITSGNTFDRGDGVTILRKNTSGAGGYTMRASLLFEEI